MTTLTQRYAVLQRGSSTYDVHIADRNMAAAQSLGVRGIGTWTQAMNDEWQDWPAAVDEHPLDVPDFLRIPQEARRAAWARVTLTVDGVGLPPDKGPGSVCRRAGIPDGIDQGLVEHLEMLEAAKEARSKALLYEMDERRKQEKAELTAVKEAVKHRSAKRRRFK